ncbi:hypothetical protein [Nocardia sp. CC227C]|uniref:hypothetical protein n=1 Tax=Nocardia sp. CC227C TaxID=3044562 RepID=UPI00278C4BC8|nr:hypothetical protein [Nocardia sp. CC227C]
MEREHEEAMRTEFAAQAERWRTAYEPGVTEAKLDEIYRTASECDQRWQTGPHAEHWQYLTDAYSDWRARPDTMNRLLDDVEHNRAQGWDGGVTDIQRRSLHQTRDLAHWERSQQRTHRPGIERGR